MMKQLVRGLKSLFAKSEGSRPARRPRQTVRLRLERLEDRDCPAVFTVVNLNDANMGQITDPNTGDGQGDFRWCLTQANQHAGQDTIWCSVSGQVNLSQALPTVMDDVDIWGNGLTLARSTAQGTPEFSVLTISSNPAGEQITANIHDVTFTNGKVGNLAQGGGIKIIDAGNVNLTFCRVNNNTAGKGGGIFVTGSGSWVTLDECFIENNVATGEGGGGIAIDQGTLYIESGTIVHDNRATDPMNGGFGGGVYVLSSADVFITNAGTEIYNNTARLGGGVCIRATAEGQSPSVWLQDGATIRNNTATDGGGIYQNGGFLSAENVTIRNNTATNKGGGLYLQDGSATVNLSVVFDTNSAANGGKGILRKAAATFSGTPTLLGGDDDVVE